MRWYDIEIQIVKDDEIDKLPVPYMADYAQDKSDINPASFFKSYIVYFQKGEFMALISKGTPSRNMPIEKKEVRNEIDFLHNATTLLSDKLKILTEIFGTVIRPNPNTAQDPYPVSDNPIAPLAEEIRSISKRIHGSIDNISGLIANFNREASSP